MATFNAGAEIGQLLFVAGLLAIPDCGAFLCGYRVGHVLLVASVL